MNKTLRIAFLGMTEDEVKTQEPEEVKEEDQPTIVMTGPLSEIYTKALSVVYAKKDTVTNEIVFESQANDAIRTIHAIQAAYGQTVPQGVATIARQIESNNFKPLKKNVRAYVVDYSMLTDSNIAEAANDNFLNSSLNDNSDNYFVVDYEYDASKGNTVVFDESYFSAMEARCEKLNMKFVFGMESFLNRLNA
jgi:hypothetical protein